MAGKKSDLGPIGVQVQQAVRDLRNARNLSYAELSRRLADLGRDIPPLGLRRIESGDRRVDVDDLAALAVALNVSPLALLLPQSDSSVVPEGDKFPASAIWNWGAGRLPLQFDNDNKAESTAFIRDSNPLVDFKEAMFNALTGPVVQPRKESDGDD